MQFLKRLRKAKKPRRKQLRSRRRARMAIGRLRGGQKKAKRRPKEGCEEAERNSRGALE